MQLEKELPTKQINVEPTLASWGRKNQEEGRNFFSVSVFLADIFKLNGSRAENSIKLLFLRSEIGFQMIHFQILFKIHRFIHSSEFSGYKNRPCFRSCFFEAGICVKSSNVLDLREGG